MLLNADYITITFLKCSFNENSTIDSLNLCYDMNRRIVRNVYLYITNSENKEDKIKK